MVVVVCTCSLLLSEVLGCWSVWDHLEVRRLPGIVGTLYQPTAKGEAPTHLLRADSPPPTPTPTWPGMAGPSQENKTNPDYSSYDSLCFAKIPDKSKVRKGGLILSHSLRL